MRGGQGEDPAYSVGRLAGGACERAGLLNQNLLPHHYKVLLHVFESESEGFFLGPVFFHVDFVDGFGGRVVNSSHHGSFSDGVALVVDELDELFSLFIRNRLVLLSHSTIGKLERNR